MLELRDLYCGYGDGDVLRGISLKAAKGEFLCVAGPNGCGKSTLLKAISRLLPFRGSVTVDGQETNNFSRKELARRIALLGQISPLYFPYTVYDTVAMGRYAHRKSAFGDPGGADKKAVEEALATLNLDTLQNKPINELSGGQLQRVFLARTLAQDPGIILLDEPTNHLDLKNQIALLDHLKAWVKSTVTNSGRLIVAVFHDLNVSLNFGDTAALMAAGKITALGAPEDVFTGPALTEAYGMDVCRFMRESLKKWKAGIQ